MLRMWFPRQRPSKSNSGTVTTRFVPEKDVPLTQTWALDPVTQKPFLLPAAGWVVCSKPPVPIMINAADLEKAGRQDYYNRIAAHEVCHVALHQECDSETEAIEVLANACAAEIVQPL